MNEQKIAGMIGLAVRCRQTAAGMDACRIMIRSRKCGVLLADAGAGPNTRKKAEDLCRPAGTPVMVLPAGLIEKATGKGNMVVAVQKGSFAEQLLKIYEGQPIHNPEY